MNVGGHGRRRILALDTGTAAALVALGEADGRLVAGSRWSAGHRHGEELLERVAALLTEERTPLGELGGIVVGTGPGAFTGLRVGIATAKGLAHALRIPLVGVGTGAAFLEAAAREGIAPAALLLPAGPSDRVLVTPAGASIVPGGTEPALPAGHALVAVDLDDRAPADAVERGGRVQGRLAASLVALGAARLAAGGDELATLVPDYVTLPRGVREIAGEVAWSHDRR